MIKTIEIKKIHIRNLLMSLIIGFIILYCLEHFGKFSYILEDNDSPKVSSIYYRTYFKNQIQTSGNGFVYYDMNFEDSDFNKYNVKSYYYTQATKEDYKYGFFISIFIFSVFSFFSFFKLKLI
jgi:hypothetical protein